ncbi:unnamed protein product, partial [Prorocentrum cordatum]
DVLPGRPPLKLPYHQEDSLVLQAFRGEAPVGEAVLRLQAAGGAGRAPVSFQAEARLLDECLEPAGPAPAAPGAAGHLDECLCRACCASRRTSAGSSRSRREGD